MSKFRKQCKPITRRAPDPRLSFEPLEAREVPAVVGGLDLSFDTDGKASTTFGGTDAAVATAIQTDGKIVVVGNTSVGSDFAIARYNPDGSLDTTFDTDGKATINFGFAANDEKATSVAIQDDGKIVIAGFATIGGDQDFIVARLKTDGSLDTTFSTDGKASFSFGGGGTNNDQAFGVAVQGTGAARKIVLAGTTDQGAGTGIDFGLVRFNDDGTVDNTFNAGGTPGKVTKTLGGTDNARAVAIDSQNRIVVAGFTNAFGTNDFGVVRFKADGTTDPTFNSGNPQTLNFGADDQANAVAIQPDDKIVLAGFDDAGAADFAVTRFNTDGSVDTATFNPTGVGALNSAPGRFTFNFGSLGVVEKANAVALQPDGKIVLAGFSAVGGTNDFAAARVTSAGALDTTFDTDGLALVNFGSDDQGTAVALDNNGRVVIAGSSAGDFAVARLIGSVEQAERLAVGGSLDGKAQVFTPDVATGNYVATGTVTGLGTTTANARVAVGDVNGDGFEDTILVTGPGTAIRLAVVSGKDGTTALVAPFDPLTGGFTGGGFVSAADIDHDGRAEVIVTPDQGGGPRVVIFSLATDGTFTQRASFFGIDDPGFRGGARSGVGDVNGDGVADLSVAAGFQGGPRIALFDGKTVLDGTTPVRLVGDFFAFDPVLRNGAYVAIGDVNGDGFGDLIFGAGPGGAPRILTVSGQALLTAGSVSAIATPLSNFFVAGNIADRGGVRVAAVDADGDNKADVVVGSGEGSVSGVRVYLGKNFSATTTEPATFQDLNPFGGVVLTDGVFVG